MYKKNLQVVLLTTGNCVKLHKITEKNMVEAVFVY